MGGEKGEMRKREAGGKEMGEGEIEKKEERER